MGKEEVMPHDERYEAAEEYMDIVYQYSNPHSSLPTFH
jgi:alkanesulfonate monooxygenase SsuD/methylene tetrahydromethanopterin reductase-like flavin-dependent oxidoreductase (luciferase family)